MSRSAVLLPPCKDCWSAAKSIAGYAAGSSHSAELKTAVAGADVRQRPGLRRGAGARLAPRVPHATAAPDAAETRRISTAGKLETLGDHKPHFASSRLLDPYWFTLPGFLSVESLVAAFWLGLGSDQG